MINLLQPDYKNTPGSASRPRYSYAPAGPASPAVSVVTPFYNEGPVFHDTAKSVLEQSLQQWEWLIVDDCSDNPDSRKMLARYTSGNDPRIRLITTKGRSGPGGARNLGVEMASASYIAFLDSDDLYEPTVLEKWYWFLESNPQYDFVKGYQVGFDAQEYLWREGFHSGVRFLENNHIQTATMLRRQTYLDAGGMDPSIRGGFEDWDLWLKFASRGKWGGTIPEFLDWYRRRPHHGDRWETWDDGEKTRAFREEMKRRYPALYAGAFPAPEPSYMLQYAGPGTDPFLTNRLEKKPRVKRILMLLPYLAMGGSDKFTLDLIEALIRSYKWEVTIVTTLKNAHDWRHRFESLTPDVFTLDTFLCLRDYPRFVRYIVRSRQPDAVFVTHCSMGYDLLPFLRSEFPDLPCYDYVHIEEPTWKDGGYPRQSVVFQPFLDKNVASSRHLADWMIEQGAKAEKLEVVTTNIDSSKWSRSGYDSAHLKRQYGIPETTPVILFAGRLHDQKQPDILGEVLKNLRDRGARFVCLVAGDGPWETWLRDFVDANHLSQVRLLGARPVETVQEMLAFADIFFLPSKHEGISLAIYEAMAMEVIPVGGDVGGQRELVTEDCGFLIPLDENQVTRYTDILSDLLLDSRARRVKAQNARDRVVRHFPLSMMARRMNEILSKPGEKFSAGLAFEEFHLGFAREVIEKQRLETIADELWRQRQTFMTSGASAASVNAPTSSPVVRGKGLSESDLEQARSIVAGRPGGYLRVLTSETEAVRATLPVALRLALAVRWKQGNRERAQQLLQILSKPGALEAVNRMFDPDYYLSRNSDVPQRAPLALLHFMFYGAEEGRAPSASFDVHSVPAGEDSRPSFVAWLKSQVE